jgi:hypothetical protein
MASFLLSPVTLFQPGTQAPSRGNTTKDKKWQVFIISDCPFYADLNSLPEAHGKQKLNCQRTLVGMYIA